MNQDVIDRAAEAVCSLRGEIKGRVISLADDEYAIARRVWNGAGDHHPAAIAFCDCVEDVQAAVRVAQSYGLRLSVRGGGHDPWGRAVQPAALVIDLSRMKSVRVDGENMIVGGGATATQVLATAAASDLIAVTGWNGCPGMAGLVTGGGYGPLLASHGLALDSLIEAELVLAASQQDTVDQKLNPDLLWALRGGGGNFGVVTSMKIRLHQARPVLGGIILFPWGEAEKVLKSYAEAINSISNSLSVVIGMIALPDGNPALFLAPAWTGDMARGEMTMDALIQLGTPMHTQIASMSYQALVESFDARVMNDRHYALETRWMPQLDLETISTLIGAAARRTAPGSTIILQHFRGEPTRVPVGDTAFGLRRDHILVEIIACWDPATGDTGYHHRLWAHDLCQALTSTSLPGGYPNILGPHAQDQIAHAYGDNLRRLQAVKRRFDPDGIFSATPIPV